MTPGRIVEPLDDFKYIRPGLVPCSINCSLDTFVFIDEKRLSIAALIQTSPDRLVLRTMPLSAIRR
jgi:hypothetical protein